MNVHATRPYDPELPILFELETLLHERAVALVTAPAAPVAAPAAAVSPGRVTAGPAGPAGSAPLQHGDPPRSETRRRQAARGRRVLRRAGLLAGVTGLIGASAFATRSLVVSGGDDGDPSLRTTAAAEIAHGASFGEQWSLSGARRGRDLCDALIVEGAVATSCDRPPGRAGMLLDGLLSPRGRYLVGLTGPAVASVELRIGDERRAVATKALGAPATVRAAQLPRGTRWFVVVLPRDRRSDHVQATAIPRREDGRRLGPPRRL